MMNYVVLIGRLTSDLEIKEVNDKKVVKMTLATQRSFKNMDGIYETDFFDITLWNGIAENTAEYCHKGDLVGIKGRLQDSVYEKEDGTKEHKLEIIADKVTFLSTNSEKINEKVGNDNGNN